MRRSIASLVILALTSLAVTFPTAACSGCDTSASALADSSDASGCGSGNGAPAPKPTNKFATDCTENLEGPDNTPPGYITASIEFSCIDTVSNVVMSLVVWRSTNPGGPIAIDANKVGGNTCDSLTGPCEVKVPCTEGAWLAGYTVGGTIDDEYYTDFGKSSMTTYSAGDCQL